MVNLEKEQRPINIYLEWILDAINDIETYNQTKSLDEFLQDKKTIDSCLMKLVHIWETIVRITKIYPDFDIPNMNNIKWMRNFIAHQYMEIRPSLIYITITKYIPQMKNDIVMYINNNK